MNSTTSRTFTYIRKFDNVLCLYLSIFFNILKKVRVLLETLDVGIKLLIINVEGSSLLSIFLVAYLLLCS